MSSFVVLYSALTPMKLMKVYHFAIEIKNAVRGSKNIQIGLDAEFT